MQSISTIEPKKVNVSNIDTKEAIPYISNIQLIPWESPTGILTNKQTVRGGGRSHLIFNVPGSLMKSFPGDFLVLICYRILDKIFVVWFTHI